MKNLKTSQERGVALLIALLMVLILLALGGVYLLISQTAIKRSTLDESYVSALFIAEAGAERAIWKIKDEWVKNNRVWVSGFGTKTNPVGIKDGNIRVGSYYVKVEDLGRSIGYGGTQTRKLKITSVGRRGEAIGKEVGGAVRAVEVIVELIGPGVPARMSDVFDYAYFLNNWGWWGYGGGDIGGLPREWVRGDMRSNGRFDFWPVWVWQNNIQAPRVDGHIYANFEIDERFDSRYPRHSHLRGAAGTCQHHRSDFTLPGRGEIVIPPHPTPKHLPFQHPYAGKGDMPNLQNPQYYRALATGTLIASHPERITINGIYGDDEVYRGVRVKNVVLEGTFNEPIVLNGAVYIEGDVIIKGYVTGQGTIYAGRNIYIADSIIYKNPPTELDDPNIRGYFPRTKEPNSYPSEAEISEWQKRNAKKDILAVAARESIILGDYTDSQWFAERWLFDFGSEDVGKDGIPKTRDEGEGDGRFGDPRWDKNYEDIDEDGVFDCVHGHLQGQNYNWSNVTVTGVNDRNSDALDARGREFGNRGRFTRYRDFSPYAVSQLDGIYYTQHFMAGILHSPVSNGALISRDEAMVYWNNFMWNYDFRVHSKYRNDPNWPINLRLPPTQGRPAPASVNVISWKEVKP